MPHIEHIILFDGVCNLCNATVRFIIRHDNKKTFKFVSLQSPEGQIILKAHFLSTTDFESFVYVKGEKQYVKSTAILKVFQTLGGIWKLMYFFIIFPRPLRDLAYIVIAKNRYKWFGKSDTCSIK